MIILVRVIAVAVVADLVITLAAVDLVGHQNWLLVEVLVFIYDDQLLILLILLFLLLLFFINLEVRVLQILIDIVLLASLVILATAPILKEQIVILLRHDVGVRHVRDVRRFLVGICIIARCRRDWLLFDDNFSSIFTLCFGCLIEMSIDDLDVTYGLRHESIVVNYNYYKN